MALFADAHLWTTPHGAVPTTPISHGARHRIAPAAGKLFVAQIDECKPDKTAVTGAVAICFIATGKTVLLHAAKELELPSDVPLRRAVEITAGDPIA